MAQNGLLALLRIVHVAPALAFQHGFPELAHHLDIGLGRGGPASRRECQQLHRKGLPGADEVGQLGDAEHGGLGLHVEGGEAVHGPAGFVEHRGEGHAFQRAEVVVVGHGVGGGAVAGRVGGAFAHGFLEARGEGAAGFFFAFLVGGFAPLAAVDGKAVIRVFRGREGFLLQREFDFKLAVGGGRAKQVHGRDAGGHVLARLEHGGGGRHGHLQAVGDEFFDADLARGQQHIVAGEHLQRVKARHDGGWQNKAALEAARRAQRLLQAAVFLAGRQEQPDFHGQPRRRAFPVLRSNHGVGSHCVAGSVQVAVAVQKSLVVRGVRGEPAHGKARGFDPALGQIEEGEVGILHRRNHAQLEAFHARRRVELGHACLVRCGRANHLVVRADEVHRDPAQRLGGANGIGENHRAARRALLHNQAHIGHGHQLAYLQPLALGVLHAHHVQPLHRPLKFQLFQVEVEQAQAAFFGQAIHRNRALGNDVADAFRVVIPEAMVDVFAVLVGARFAFTFAFPAAVHAGVAVLLVAAQQLLNIVGVDLRDGHLHLGHFVDAQTQVAVPQRIQVHGLFAAGEAQARPLIAKRNSLAERLIQPATQQAVGAGQQADLVSLPDFKAAAQGEAALQRLHREGHGGRHLHGGLRVFGPYGLVQQHRHHGLAIEQGAAELAHFQRALVGDFGLGGKGFLGGLGARRRAQAGRNVHLHRRARPHVLHKGQGHRLVGLGRIYLYGHGLAVLGHAQAGFHIGRPHGVVKYEVRPQFRRARRPLRAAVEHLRRVHIQVRRVKSGAVQGQLLLTAGQGLGLETGRENRAGPKRFQRRKRQFPVARPLKLAPNSRRKGHEARGVPAVLLALVHHLFIESKDQIGVGVDFVAISLGLSGGLLLSSFFGARRSSQQHKQQG